MRGKGAANRYSKYTCILYVDERLYRLLKANMSGNQAVSLSVCLSVVRQVKSLPYRHHLSHLVVHNKNVHTCFHIFITRPIVVVLVTSGRPGDATTTACCTTSGEPQECLGARCMLKKSFDLNRKTRGSNETPITQLNRMPNMTITLCF